MWTRAMTAWMLFGLVLSVLVIFLIFSIIVVCDILGWVLDQDLHARLRELANYIIMKND